MYSVMWSEHCSYKSSKVHFSLWGENTTDEMREKLLVGIGENAGVVDIGDGWAVTFKVESHNHPSYVEPYQGAATGVGGIVRDIMSMGARPIAIMDPLRFGNLHHPDTLRVLPGIVAGVGRLRQLPGVCPTSAARSSSTTATKATRSSTRSVRRVPCGSRTSTSRRLGASGNQDRSSSGPGPVATASVASRCSPPRRSRPVRPDEASGRAGRRPVRREGPHRVLPRPLRREGRRRYPGPRRGWVVLCHQRARVERRRRYAGRARPGAAAGRLAAARGDPHVGVAGTDDGGGRTAAPRPVPRDHCPLGRRGDGHRRGHRGGAARHHLARRGRRRRAAPVRRSRRPGLPSPAGAAGIPGPVAGERHSVTCTRPSFRG